MASWEELQSSISRINAILPMVEDEHSRRRILQGLSAARATFEAANATLMDCIPSSALYMSSASGVREDEAEELLRAVDRDSAEIGRLKRRMEEEVRVIDDVISSSSRSSSAQSYQSSHYSSAHEEQPSYTHQKSPFTIHPIHMPFNPDYRPESPIYTPPETSEHPALAPASFYPSTPRTPADYSGGIDIKPTEDYLIPPLPPISKHSTPSPTTFYPYGLPQPPQYHPSPFDRYSDHPYDAPPPMSRGPSNTSYRAPSLYENPHRKSDYPAPGYPYHKHTTTQRPPPIPIPRTRVEEREYDYPSFDYDSSYPEHFREFLNPAPPPLPPVGYTYGSYKSYGSGGYEDRPFTRYI